MLWLSVLKAQMVCVAVVFRGEKLLQKLQAWLNFDGQRTDCNRRQQADYAIKGKKESNKDTLNAWTSLLS